MERENKPYSVTELNTHIKLLLDSDPFLSAVSVRGELSNYKIYPSGHHYFTLKDAESSLRCVMFKSSASKLRFRPENGMKATVSGRIAVYPRDGAYQLYAGSILPDGVGDLQVAFEQLKEKLRAEGLFDSAHKKPLPAFPQRIAVITSSAGAAVRDIIRVAGKRWPMAKLLVLPVHVQGEEAPAEIAGALRYCNRYEIGDLIITGRGGGSMEDLWAFNDERVARAIYESHIPVISAVGHEPDVTISDYVADLRAATPSNAAELAVPDCAEMREVLEGYEIRSMQAMRKEMNALRRRLDDLSGRRVMLSHTEYLDDRRVELDFLRSRLSNAGERMLSQNRQSYARLGAALDAMSPLKVLSRGYAIAQTKQGSVLRSVQDVSVGDTVEITLPDGSVDCTATTIREKNNA